MRAFVWLILLMSPTLVCAQVQVSVGNVNVAAGAKTVVPVFLSDGQAISALQFDLSFDTTTLTLSGSDRVLKGDLCKDHGMLASVSGGTVKATVFSSSLATFKAGSGSVAQVVFDVVSGSPSGKTAALTLANVKAYDATGATVATTTVNGTATVGTGMNQPVAGQNGLVFAQIANGAVGQGSFYTLVILVNQTQAPASGRIKFTKSDGTPFVLTVTGKGSGSEFDVTVPPSGSAYLQTDGKGPLAVGYAVVSSTGPIGGTALFGWKNGSGGTITEAGVGASASEALFFVPVVYVRDVTSTGVAVANLTTSGIQLTVKLKDTSGNTVGTTTLDLAAGQHKPAFVHEPALFASLATQASFSGTLEITAPKGVAVTAVKQTVQEGLITTFPIIPAR